MVRHREVHILDFIKAHEGNQNFLSGDPTKIHWAKFDMIGKFIKYINQYQVQCKNAAEYNFAERPDIRKLMEHPVMDSDVRVALSYR